MLWVYFDVRTLGLDLTTSDGIKQSLKDLSKQAIVIITSHDLKALNDIATQTLYIQDGSIVDHHKVLQVLENLLENQKILIGTNDAVPEFCEYEIGSVGTGKKYLMGKEAFRRKISSVNIENLSIQTYGNTIEDVYRELYKENKV